MQIRIIFVVIEHRPSGFPAGLLYEKPLCRHGDRAVFHDRGEKGSFLEKGELLFFIGLTGRFRDLIAGRVDGGLDGLDVQRLVG